MIYNSECNLSFFPAASLCGDACLGSIGFPAVNILSSRDWYARNLGKIDFPPQFVQFCHLREKLASRRGSFGRFYTPKEDPKLRWDRNSYGRGIISGYMGEIMPQIQQEVKKALSETQKPPESKEPPKPKRLLRLPRSPKSHPARKEELVGIRL